MAKELLGSFIRGLIQITWNGFRPLSACLEAAGQFSLRKLGSQGRRPPTREACLSYDGQAIGQGCLVVVTVQPELCASVLRIRCQAEAGSHLFNLRTVA
jgi:hypothetical protein